MEFLLSVLRSDSNKNHRRIVRGIIHVTAFLIIGKFTAAAKDIAFAYRYGVSALLDIYFIAVVIVSWLPTIVTSITQAILVPIISKNDEQERQALHSQMVTTMLIIGGLSVFLVVFAISPLMPWYASDFSDPERRQLTKFVIFLSPIALLSCFIALFSSELLARENHSNTLLEAVPAVVLLLALLLYRPSTQDWTILLIATVGGIALQAAALAYLVNRRYVLSIPSFVSNLKFWQEVRKGLSILLLGTVAMSFVSPIDQWLAARAGNGAVSTFLYANRLLLLGVTLAVTVISRAILPILCEPTITEGERLRLTIRWGQIMSGIALLVIVVIWPLSHWIVKILFERGEFVAENTQQVSALVQVGLLQLPFLFLGMVFVQYFISRQQYEVVAISGVIAVLVKLFLGYLLVEFYGLTGLMVSTAAMLMATCLYFCYQLYTQK